MADAATVTITATMLPDEIARVFSGSMTVTPTDANDKWYYKLTTVSTSSTSLIQDTLLSQLVIRLDFYLYKIPIVIILFLLISTLLHP
jgi:hypothetical protein